MSETGADKEFYQAAENAFIRRRGTPFLLSPKDYALLREWRALGIPLEAIEQGIDDAFTRREERSATGRVNSLGYCRDAVLAAWERRAEASLGRGEGRRSPEPEPDPVLSSLQVRLGELTALRPDLSTPLEAARRSVERLAGSGKASGEIELSLARLDKRLATALLEALSAAERQDIERAAATRLRAARAKMDDPAASRTLHALERRLLRERLDLPRLTLLP